MRTETIVRTMYEFDELTPIAKAKALDWYRNTYADDDASRNCADAADEIKGILQRLFGAGAAEDIYYSVAYVQGDGACFTGTFRYMPGAIARLKKDEPWFYERFKEGLDQWRTLQRRNFYRLRFAIEKREHHYQHENTVSVSLIAPETGAVTNGALGEGTCIFKSIMWETYKYMRSIVYDCYTDGTIVESIRANEYEFLEDGRTA